MRGDCLFAFVNTYVVFLVCVETGSIPCEILKLHIVVWSVSFTSSKLLIEEKYKLKEDANVMTLEGVVSELACITMASK